MNSGFLLINKPSGPTSHDIIDRLRHITGIRKIGHAGTLDPFASGLLIVAVERTATRRLSEFVGLDKSYEAVLQLGYTSDTHDREGKIQVTSNKEQTITKKQILEVLKTFVGEQLQTPPMFSAKKVRGKKLYELAREGKEIERAPITVQIYDLRFKNYDSKKMQVTVNCVVSSGTYIRSLGYDIGEKLGTGAYLQELNRTSIGKYKLEDAVDISELTSENWKNYLKELI